MPELQVDVPQKKVTYPLKIEKGILNQVGSEVSAIFKGQKVALISDETVYQYYGEKTVRQLKDAGYAVQSIVLPPGEQTKTFDSMPAIYSQLLDFGLTRSDCVLALGGGVVGDIAGFVAASFLRGVTFIQVPTTLLAQVDSSVGGKVGVDLPEGKNLVGAFYHPKLVLIDPLVLETLTNESFSDGMAEVIKYGCIKDKRFFQKLSGLHSRQEVMKEIESIIETCCAIKRDVVEADEKDKGERMLLNFGHTLGHAIEAYYQYERYSHGQGVAIGMVAITKLAEMKGLSPKGTTDEIVSCLKTHGLPTDLEKSEDYPDILPYIKKDKKNLDGKLHVIILDKVGQARGEQTSYTFFDSLTGGGIKVD